MRRNVSLKVRITFSVTGCPPEQGLCHDEHLIGCSAEGHVSHVLSDRMSSRPLGWCRDGANQMAHLRAYSFNKGNMPELVKAQKLPKAAGAENTFIADTANGEST